MKKILSFILMLAMVICATAIAEEECDHSWGSWNVTKEATCAENGSKIRMCEKCGKTQTEDIKKTDNHNWGSWNVTKEATCAENGSKIRMCETCGKTETADIEKTNNHNYGSWNVTKEATCAENGSKIRMCETCGKTETADIEKTNNHNYGSWNVTKEATCTEDGSKIRICETCGKTEEKEIPATGHTGVTVAGKKATCTEAGLTEGTVCSVCDAIIKAQKEIPATGHKFGEWVVTKEETCTEDGEQTRTCENCKATETEVIEALGEHTWNKGVVTKKATTTSYGEKLYTCIACGATKTEQIAKKKSSSSKSSSSGSSGSATAAPTEMPAAEDDQVYSIVTDPSFMPEEYTEEKVDNIATYTATTDNTELLHLHISLEMIASLKAEGIDTIVFNANGVSVTLPLSVFDSEMIQAVVADLGDGMTGYVLTVDPAAVAEDGTTAPAYILYAQTDVLSDITSVAEGIEIA